MNNTLALQQGDNQAFAQLYTHYRKPLYDFLHALTRSHEAAEDITHNAFLGVWENRERLNTAQGVRPYLFTVAKNMAMRHFRQKKIAANHFEYAWKQPLHDIAPEEHLYAKEADLLIEVAISRMPKTRKKIFEMYYKEDMSYDRIADTLDMNSATVANHLTHAKNDIRKILNIKKQF